MTSDPASNIANRLNKPRKRWPRDIVWSIVVIMLFVAHIALILGQACPYWSICFPCTPIAPYLWPVVAIVLAIILAFREFFFGSRGSWRSGRSILAVLLVLFSADTLTGGDYRWFEIAMRREMRKCGGATALQLWAQQVLTSPRQIASFEANGVTPKDLSPQVKGFAAEACEPPHIPLYRPINSGGPWFMFDSGGWDMGWGIILGKSDLVDPSPVNMPYGQHRGWIKRLQAGVYLYAF
jgi:hypothetical protein